MRDTWYSDRRDLAKWATVVYLTKRADAKSVLQITYYRTSERPRMFCGNDERPIPEEVWKHFRDVGAVADLATDAGFAVRVLETPFDPNRRDGYAEIYIAAIREMTGPRIVLVDPDTGLEPSGGAKPEHATEAEIRKIWNCLDPDDVLVMYQHARRTEHWREEVKKRLKCIIGDRVEEFFSPQIAGDVTFFAGKKDK